MQNWYAYETVMSISLRAKSKEYMVDIEHSSDLMIASI
jgi:hypothetical protein